jgi:hypothetical protein
MAEPSPQSGAGAEMSNQHTDGLQELMGDFQPGTVERLQDAVLTLSDEKRVAVHALTELVHLDEAAAYSVALSLRHTNASELDLRASDLLERLVEIERHG